MKCNENIKSKQAGTPTGPSSGQAWICCNQALFVQLNKNTYQTNPTNPKPNPSKPNPTKPNQTIPNHTKPYKTIPNHTKPYQTILSPFLHVKVLWIVYRMIWITLVLLCYGDNIQTSCPALEAVRSEMREMILAKMSNLVPLNMLNTICLLHSNLNANFLWNCKTWWDSWTYVYYIYRYQTQHNLEQSRLEFEWGVEKSPVQVGNTR